MASEGDGMDTERDNPAGVGLGQAEPVGVCVFDPSPLLTVTIEPNGPDDEIHLHAGGQGFWIARMARRLADHVRLVGGFGGETGTLIVPLIRQHGIEVLPTELAGGNGAYVQDRRSGARNTLAQTLGTPLTRHETDDLYGALLAAAVVSRVVVLAGPQPAEVVPEELYGRLTADLATLGTPVVADLSGAALRSALTGGVGVLKVSEEDMVRDGVLTGQSTSERLRLMDDLHRGGASAVVLTRGDLPALAFAGEEIVQIVCPPLHAVDHRGAGDAMTAAIAVALSDGSPLIEALRLGAAAGAAAVTRRGLASGQAEAVSALVPYIEIQPLPEAERPHV
jgi:1-phosphofructokinase